MEIRCRCPSCGASFRVADKHAGKKIKCSKCAGVMSIPRGEQPADGQAVGQGRPAGQPTEGRPTGRSAAVETVETFPSVDSPPASASAAKPAPPKKPKAPAPKSLPADQPGNPPSGAPSIEVESSSSGTATTSVSARGVARRKTQVACPTLDRGRCGIAAGAGLCGRGHCFSP